VSWRRYEREACRLIREACLGVNMKDVSQLAEELPLGVPESPLVGAELSLETLPGD
jgi:hypothetical protein